MACSLDEATEKLIVDPVHGDAHLTEEEWRLIDCPSFQRLRRLKQLQMGQATYPNATHTRFSHSLGTLAVMGRIVPAAKRLSPEQARLLRLAALLHDIGHYPYSHLMEQLDTVVLPEELTAGKPRPYSPTQTPYPSHEQTGSHVLATQPDLRNILVDKRTARQIADLFARTSAADPQLSKLLHSSLDIDRLDYLIRDSRACGVPYGEVDSRYLLNAIRISDTGMVGVAEKALPAAEHFLLARFFMHRAVYFHKTTFGLEEACRHLLRRLRDRGGYGIPADGNDVLDKMAGTQFALFTDAFVDDLVHRAATEETGHIRALARCVHERRPPKLVKEVRVLGRSPSEPYHAGTFFFTCARAGLRDLSERHGIPLEQFLLCRTPPVRLEPRGANLTADQARELQPEGQDELVKVFLGNETEPRSLVDVEDSLVHLIGEYSYQAFRLYVAYHGSDREDVTDRLRSAVDGWAAAS